MSNVKRPAPGSPHAVLRVCPYLPIHSAGQGARTCSAEEESGTLQTLVGNVGRPEMASFTPGAQNGLQIRHQRLAIRGAFAKRFTDHRLQEPI